MNGKRFVFYFFATAVLFAAVAAGLAIWSFRDKDIARIRLEAATSGRKAIVETQPATAP